jgi:ClpP class serine protease
LSDAGKAAIQDVLVQTYTQFTEAVARGRSTTVDKVLSGMGEGRLVTAQDGLKLGMVDGIATLDQVLSMMQRDLGSGGNGRSRASATGDEPVLVAAGAADDQIESTPTPEPAQPASDASAERPFRGTAEWRDRQLGLLD